MRRDHRADFADDGVPDRREERRPGADVPERHLYRLSPARRLSRVVDPLRLRRRRPADRSAAHRQPFFRSAAARRRTSLPAGERLAFAGAARDASMTSGWEIVIGIET